MASWKSVSENSKWTSCKSVLVFLPTSSTSKISDVLSILNFASLKTVPLAVPLPLILYFVYYIHGQRAAVSPWMWVCPADSPVILHKHLNLTINGIIFLGSRVFNTTSILLPVTLLTALIVYSHFQYACWHLLPLCFVCVCVCGFVSGFCFFTYPWHYALLNVFHSSNCCSAGLHCAAALRAWVESLFKPC